MSDEATTARARNLLIAVGVGCLGLSLSVMLGAVCVVSALLAMQRQLDAKFDAIAEEVERASEPAPAP